MNNPIRNSSDIRKKRSGLSGEPNTTRRRKNQQSFEPSLPQAPTHPGNAYSSCSSLSGMYEYCILYLQKPIHKHSLFGEPSFSLFNCVSLAQ